MIGVCRPKHLSRTQTQGSTSLAGDRRISHVAWLLLWWGAVIASVGCPNTADPPPTDPAPQGSTEPLRVLVVAESEATAELARYWNAEAVNTMEAQAISEEELAANPKEKLSGYDVVVFPSQLLPDMASEGLLLAIDKNRFDDAEFNSADLLPLERSSATRWGDDEFGLSLGHRPWVLAYRADLLEAIGETPPTTWEDFARIASRLEQPPSGSATDSEQWLPACSPTAFPWGPHLLLAHSASGIRHRGAYSGLFDLGQTEPLIATPPFIQALDRIALSAGEPGSTPQSCFEALESGRCAVAIMPVVLSATDSFIADHSPGTAGTEASTQDGGASVESTPSALIRFAPLPGSSTVYVSQQQAWRERTSSESTAVPYLGRPGMVAAITADSRRAGSSWGLLQWLTSRKTQPRLAQILPQSFPTRYSTLSSIDRWLPTALSPQAIDDLILVIRNDNQASVTMQGARFPGESDFLQPLQDAIEGRLSGGDSATLLQAAAEAWKAQIDKWGAEDFNAANQASLGL